MFSCLLLLSALILVSKSDFVSDISQKVLQRQQDPFILPSITASYYTRLHDRRRQELARKDVYNWNLAELLRMSTGPKRPWFPF